MTGSGKKSGAAIIAHLRKHLGYADEVMNELYQMMMHRTHQSVDDFEVAQRESELADGLASHLESLSTQLAVALEMLGLPETQRMFVRKWATFDYQSLRRADEWHNDNGDGVQSVPLDLCREVFQLISAAYEGEVAAGERAGLEMLKHLLSSTAMLLHEQGVKPRGETDVQRCMHPHLRATFPTFTKTLAISKPIVSFKPDCGITSLSAAIEFKFADSETEFKTAVHGLHEDVSGYAGSLDWTRYYSVIYQTRPFGTQKECTEALRRSGNADKWQVLVVTGGGERKRRNGGRKAGKLRAMPSVEKA